MRTRRLAPALGLLLTVGLVTAPDAGAAPTKVPVAIGYGGAVVSDTIESTQAGIDILKKGGTAADAAVAVAATLGVTDPYVAGLGGGGYFVHYDARSRKVSTIDGRETTPQAGSPTMFVDPATGQPHAFPTAVTSGLGVGVPGMLATWERALDRWGRFSLRDNLKPAINVAERGFTVDATFREQTRQNATRFAQFGATAELFLPGGRLPVVGSTLRNPDLADTYREIARHGTDAFYGGDIGDDVVAAVQEPPVAPGATIDPLPGLMTIDDLAGYRTIDRRPTHVSYRGYDVYGMAPSSSGGITVGESLNILERYRLSGMDRVQALHHYLEASRLAFADRGRYIGDSDYVDVPQRELLSDRFAKQRACEIDPDAAAPGAVPPGDVTAGGQCAPDTAATPGGSQGFHTNHFVVSDRWGNVVSYTNTIEQLGGSGIVVPGRGFLLNNELTDFNFAPTQGDAPDPNLAEPGKRPRSSMSPTIVLKHGKPFLAVGSPGGATIITTVLQILVNRIDLGMSLPDAIAAPRASQRNAATTQVEPAFLALPEADGLAALGHSFAIRDTSPLDPTIKISPDIGVASGLEFTKHGKVIAAGEPVRRGGSAAAVVHPAR
ncbi:gamma-glutamyltransferase [Actinophytocola algeriensis]|uniref:Glutathione hydrolase proenzyme n=1 Tax=Actinophytocola algeriensis TaxID=1768010 RepID=A0A7W7Q7G6_9PSEU|nr:gamma-glutamyltransferase [Actinophytocola algeriensis]MBB4908036.1 gamma-glutamyltranspeptidase/glutathione hydrolase [Actinophytocola algeriensis]MBE1480066.1 gamma-glutamyltranspeptidase/glutathione hydrolase [Actinophytocola algeriensis]